MTKLSLRPGATLVELLLFVVILGIISAMTIPLLFSSTENRLLQQTISIVEQNGTQAVQNMTRRIRHAERILYPPMGETGSFLALQFASGAVHPVIVGIASGSIVIVEHAMREIVSSPQVAVTDFVVRNTSTSATRQSATVSFRMSRTIKLQQPHSYVRDFDAATGLLPNDLPVGNACECLDPSCHGDNVVGWQVCENSFCLSATTPMQCP